MSERPLHVAVLQFLERRVLERREQHVEALTKGLNKRTYHLTCGRAAEAKDLAELIADVLKRLRDDELEFDDEGTDDDTIEIARTRRAPQRQRSPRARPRG